MGLFFCWSVAVVVAVAVEQLAVRHGRIAFPDLLARVAAHSSGFLLLAALSGRAGLAALLWVATTALLVAASRKKEALLGEPLVFSDLALVGTVLRNPDLYFLRSLGGWAGVTILSGAVLVIAGWLWFEPPSAVLSASSWTPAGALAGLAFVALLVASDWTGAIARRMLPRPSLESDVQRWGLILSLLLYALRWRHAQYEGSTKLTSRAAATRGEAADVVLVVQIESFLDPERCWRGALLMPGLAEARRRSALFGPLRVPAHGAYTMRTEFAVLSGLEPDALGFDKFDPYRSRQLERLPSMAREFGKRGYRTTFIHPFRADFFRRDRVMPRLGFESFISERDFADAERCGPFISDAALADRILLEIDRGSPAFVFAVTMENHGPWQPGRLPGLDDPVRQYQMHLANADRMIGRLVAELSRRRTRAIVCFFGDHPPILGRLAADAPAPETDYVLIDCRTPAGKRGTRSLTAAELGQEIIRAAGIGTVVHANDPVPHGRAGATG